MNTQAKKLDLVFTRIFNAPVAEVWKAWTDADYVKQWWGPDGFTAPVAKMDVREGGTTLVCMSSPQFGENYSTWHYKQIVPLKRIEYIHNLADKDGNKVDPVSLGMPPDFPKDQTHSVVFTVKDANTTELTVTEYNWTEGQMVELSKMGMEQCLDKMAAIFAKG